MKKVSILFLVLLGILVATVSCAQSQSPEVSPPQEKGSFRVEVSRRGFNKTPGGFRLEVEEGQEVEITFVYGDNDFSQNNPHIIAISEYGIETDVVDENTPEVTLRFTAEAGEVTFVCIKVDCVGHTNLLGGIIVIQSGG